VNRRKMLGIAGAVSLITLTSQAQESASQEGDPWIGSYLKYARYDSGRTGQFGEAQTITISKDRDGYSLSSYDDAHFREKTKGVLSDREGGGLGKIYFGSVVYADGKKETILRVEFCYEDFVLYRKEIGEKVKTSKPVSK